MSYSLPNTTAGAGYGAPLVCTGARVVQLTVANGAVLVQLGRGVGGIQWSDVESFRVPGVHTIPGPVDAVRVRRASATGPAPQYAIDAYA